MASLQDKKIKDTYEGLLKTEDNLALGAVDTKVTDGTGTETGITINSNGNVGVSGKVTFGELSDSTGSTVNKIVYQGEGIGANDNDTSLPTAAAVKDYVDNSVTAQDLDFTANTGSGAIDLDSESLNIAGVNGLETTAAGNSITVDGSSLQNRITQNESDITNNENAIDANALAIDAEEAARISADNALQFDIDVNTAAITAEQTARVNADAALQASINAEASTRQATDTSLQNQITSNDSELTALTSRVAVNETDIDTNTAAITANDIDIANLQAQKVPYTGATADVNLGEHQLSTGQVTFDQTPTGSAGVGVMRWNNTDGTLDVGLKGGNVTLQVGQEQVIRAVNGAASTLLESEYNVVKVTGAQGQRLQVELAQANSDSNSTTAIGIVTEDINKNQEGFITTSGQVRGINTTGSLQGESWDDGDVLYLSPTVPGGITNVKPITPAHLITVGYVEYAHHNNGKIFVKVDNGYEIDELHDVKVTNVTDGQILTYNSTGGYWENTTAAPGGVTSVVAGDSISVSSATGDVTITNDAPDQIVAITGQNGTSVTGTYPNFTVDSSSLESDISAEAATRASADTTLQANIDSEETDRTAADAALQSQITSNDGDITALQAGKEDKANKGAANGYAPLDSGAKINEAYLPDSILGQVSYEGTWDASTNTPALPDATLNKGHYYVVSVEGTYLGVVFHIGDWAISNGTIWEHVHNTDAVTTVFGRLGDIIANESDYSGFYPLLSDLAATDAQVATNVTDIANLQTLVTGTENDVFALSSDLDAEILARTDADSALQAQITSNDGDIASLQSSKQDNLTAGTGIDLTGDVVTNTAPDQTVVLNAGTNVTISGTYPAFTINSTTEPAPVDSVNGQTGVVVLDSDDVAEGSVNFYDKTVSITGAGATTVTGTYPNFNIESTDTLYTEGTGIDITAGVVTNTAPDQAVTITSSGSATVTGTYPNFNVDATDTNTTYTAGTGLDLTGTVFSNTAPDQTVTITGGQGVDITGTYPDFTVASVAGSQVLLDQFTGTGSQTAFTLSGTPISEDYTQVFFDGVHQAKTGYSVAGTTITFTEAPAAGLNIEVSSITTITILGEVTSVNGQIGDIVIDVPVDSVNGQTGAVVIDVPVDSVNGQTGAVALDSDDIPEGATNLYNATHTGDVTGSAALTISAGAVDGGKIATTADVHINSLGVGTAAPTTAGLIRATNDVVAYYSSDKRLKDNIKPIEGALDKVSKLGGYEFDWNNKQDVYEGHDIGVIAQEVEAVFPELVTTRDSGFKAVKYEKLVSVLIEAVKELRAEVETLKTK